MIAIICNIYMQDDGMPGWHPGTDLGKWHAMRHAKFFMRATHPTLTPEISDEKIQNIGFKSKSRLP